MAGDKNGSNFAAMPRASIFYTGEATEEKEIDRQGGPLILLFLVEMEAFGDLKYRVRGVLPPVF